MEMTDILKQIDSLKNEAQNLQPVKPELEKVFWDKFRLEFNYNSNHMEGNTLTYGHTQLLLLFDKVGGDYSLRELEEMKAHDVALKLIKEAALGSEHILTEKFIKEINKTILVRPYYNEAITSDGQPTKRLIQPGQYKQYPNSVLLQNGEMFNYASPEETAAQMGDLMDWYRKEVESKELHPVQLAALFHYRFVRIHPFDDSNGRTTRLMMNYILIRNGFAPVVIESADKKNYLTALNKADTGDIKAFVEYISKLALRWQGLYLKALKGEKIEEEGDFDKEVEILKKQIEHKKASGSGEIYNVITKSFLPLINDTKLKLSKLDDFYISTSDFTLATDGLGNDYDLNKFIDKYSTPPVPIGNQFSFEYKHKDLKSTQKDIDYTTSICLTFQSNSYVLFITPTDKQIELKLNHFLTKKEIESISTGLAKKELDFIKQNT